MRESVINLSNIKAYIINVLIKVVVNVITYILGRNKLNILTYHRVGHSGHALAMDEGLFEQHLIWINRYFTPVSLAEGLALQAKGLLPRGAIAITVDDGYADSYSTIFPLLKKHDLKATFFISTIGFENGYLWDEKVASIIMKTKQTELNFNHQNYSLLTNKERVVCLTDCLSKIKYKTIEERDALIDQLVIQSQHTDTPQQFLTKEQTVELYKSGMGIGAHTHTHPILLKESEDIALHEIIKSKKILEEIIETPIEYFAYPNGKFGLDFDHIHMEMVKRCGFLGALSTDKGILKDQIVDGFQIKRFTPWDKTEFKFSLRLALNYLS
jgi:peptidoglycan/xylan/chitin deacetylase (PgdA/CDA1 family)